jgi:hypothetical protein
VAYKITYLNGDPEETVDADGPLVAPWAGDQLTA